MTHDFPRLKTTPITLRERSKESETCGVSAANALAVATRTVAVIVALKDDGAQYGALSILLFLVKQLVKLASVCAKDDDRKSTVVIDM
jgi:hypothetical protein